MNHLIFARWSVRYPDRFQLFSLPTPTGMKIVMMPEETGLAYVSRRIDIMANENHDPVFLALNPNGIASSRTMLNLKRNPAVELNVVRIFRRCYRSARTAVLPSKGVP